MFIELTYVDGNNKIVVNCDQIKFIEDLGDHTRINMLEQFIGVKESYEDVKKLLGISENEGGRILGIESIVVYIIKCNVNSEEFKYLSWQQIVPFSRNSGCGKKRGAI